MYYSVKCSHGANEYGYKRSFKKHNHEAQQAFVQAAMQQAVADLAAAGVAGVTTDQLTLSAIRQAENDPGNKYTEI
jgi:hypothetical protein